MKKVLLSVLALAWLQAGLSLSIADELSPPPQAAAAGFHNLVFSDDFTSLRSISRNGSGTTSKWYNGIWYEAPSPASDITQLSDTAVGLTVQTGDSHDTTIMTATRAAGGPYPHAWNYGYYEVLAQMPQSNTPQSNDAIWLFSLSHMLGTDTTPTGNEWCELDMMEQTGPGAPISVNGNFVGTVHDHVYTSSNNQITKNQNTNSYQPISGLDETRWHIYGVLWTPSTITWYLDNKAVISWPTPAICQTQQMFMLLSAQVNAPQTVPVKLNVDWVRVWH